MVKIELKKRGVAIREAFNQVRRYSKESFNSDTLLVMRPYQIAAIERILWKLNSSYQAKNWSNTESGGYIWHTTGSVMKC